MERIKGILGFGGMRLPMKDGEVVIDEMNRMVDAFLEAGFNYFDTAHGYLQGQSELALRECLARRYPWDRFALTDKLTDCFFKSQADIRPLFEAQLQACGVEYFDFYLMHAQGLTNYDHFKACRAFDFYLMHAQNEEKFAYFKTHRAYETAFALKAEGKIRHVGISFHDRAEVLEQILTDYPDIEVVQLQFNYLDYDDPAVQSRRCYEVCCRHNKPVLVMEPAKGGSLVNLPPDARAVLDGLHGGAPASYALRFVGSFPGIRVVLSGMGSVDRRVQEIFHSKNLIPCTACRYCTDGCPKHISIPDLFAIMNTKQIHHDWNAHLYYDEVHTAPGRRASDCIKCGKCEKACPQHLPIRQLLEQVSQEFDKA